VIDFNFSPPSRILHVCTESGQEALSTAVLHGEGSVCVCVCVLIRLFVRILSVREDLWKLNSCLL
jgi:hypothetical protein